MRNSSDKESASAMVAPSIIPGNGLTFYFRTDKPTEVSANAERVGSPVEEEIHVDENSTKEELSSRDLDGHYLTISAFHTYGG